MRWSKSCIPTLKEIPHEAEIPSHRLMLRAGLIKKLTSGIYTFLPLGFRVLKNIERIVREEMDAIGCQEVLMPILHPTGIYEESGRLDKFGPELFTVRDSRKRLFALGPTHEEVITMVARDEMRSYRDLPQCLYQILTKFRDEIRPRYGVIRAREFIMKDAYSFSEDDESLDKMYRDMESAYGKIIQRCGLDYRMVEADSGYIGGSESHEFMVLAENGESEILSCECGYGVNLERGAAREAEEQREGGGGGEDFREVETPGVTTVEKVARFLNVSPREIVKTLLYRVGERTVAVLVPGDREVNDIKLATLFEGDGPVRFLEPDEIRLLTGGPVGFSGPVGLPGKVEIYADQLLERHGPMIVGANKGDRHLRGVCAGRDFTITRFADLVWAREGDLCPTCNRPMKKSSGVEVGHIFKLGDKYSTSMNATFLDRDGTSKPFIMGCYGFGISRMAAAVIEQHHDEDGIVWPMSVAPFKIMILPVNVTDETVMERAFAFERELEAHGIEPLLDDRNLSPGVKFKDADLVGIPLRLTVGKKLREGKVELFSRAKRRIEEIPADEAIEMIISRIGD